MLNLYVPRRSAMFMSEENGPDGLSGRVNLPAGFTVTAHSGCMGLPKNSIEAMEEGVRAGAAIVEFDLQFTPDGEPVLSHDPPEGTCVPLSAAFDFLRKHPGILGNVDVKNTDHLQTLLPMAQQAGVLPQIFLTGIYAKDVPTVREKCPGVPFYLNVKKGRPSDFAAIADKAKACGAVGLNVNKRVLTKRLVHACRARGLLVSVWTVDRARRARKILAMQPDNVTTRKPDMLMRIIMNT